ncbi:MAG: glycosyltransferase family 4 protein [Candidatus Omnitrophica bacterium]|nr:glycosyltransferase family 4 protein [Candidatus Omnitrophota bacterium]
MKVVFFSRFPRDIDTPRGGVESATVNLAAALAAMDDIDIHVVTFEKQIRRAEVSRIGEITVHRLPAPGCPQILDVSMGPGRRRLKKYITALKPDIVHFHETYGLGIGRMPVPCVFTVHGFDSANIPVESGHLGRKSWIRAPLWKFVESRGLARQKRIISITPYVRERIEPLTRARIYDIDNAISRAFFDIPRAEITGRVFSAGWISRRKNTLGIVRAFAAAIKGVEIEASLHIAGEKKDPGYSEKVESEIGLLGISDRVSLPGRIPQERMKQALSEAGIFVLASYQENAPMAIAEAMASGIPVISSNRCGMPYMVEDGKTGYLVDPDNTAALADRLRMLLTDRGLRKKMGEAARHSAEARFHPDVVAGKTREVYEKMLEGAGHAPALPWEKE